MNARTIERLVLAATTYRLAAERGEHPVDAVAARLGISQGAAKQRIWRARRAGLLAPECWVFDIREDV